MYVVNIYHSCEMKTTTFDPFDYKLQRPTHDHAAVFSHARIQDGCVPNKKQVEGKKLRDVSVK